MTRHNRGHCQPSPTSLMCRGHLGEPELRGRVALFRQLRGWVAGPGGWGGWGGWHGGYTKLVGVDGWFPCSAGCLSGQSWFKTKATLFGGWISRAWGKFFWGGGEGSPVEIDDSKLFLTSTSYGFTKSRLSQVGESSPGSRGCFLFQIYLGCESLIITDYYLLHYSVRHLRI